MKTYERKRQEYQEIENVQELCRLCLEKAEEGIPIFKGQDVCAAVAMRIMICVGLEMTHEDMLPNKVCTSCFQELEKYYKFRRRCEVSYFKLKSHLTALKFKNYKDVKLEETVEDQPNANTKCLDLPAVDNTEESVLQVTKDENELALEIVEKQMSQINVVMEEVQIPIQTEANPDISTFLSTVLKELGILVQHDEGLVLQDHGISSFELETGHDDQMVLELVEEDDEVIIEPTTSKEIEEVVISNGKRKQNKKGADCKVSGTWCALCGRVFASRSAAARHARAHGGARPYACPTCARTFAQKSVRDRHMLVHLAVRPHRCSLCSKSFTQRGSLEAHARAHAAPAARPLALHRCATCDKVFLHASGLSRHMKTHAGRVFSCAMCDKQFRDRSSLVRHRKHFRHGPHAGANAS